MEIDTLPNSQQALADRIDRQVRQRTTGLIRDLKIEVLPGEVLLTGRAATYYAKQLATHAALDACDHLTLTNDIEVY
ncbi:MAG TPA: BON domain-containing protein [Planctomycetaceae bacterium]|nr:BON domain-containing protein [Planctomycetaceae bacterium]